MSKLLIICLTLAIYCYIKQINAAHCECHSIPPSATPGRLTLKCGDQKLSEDCNCFLYLPKKPAWHTGNAGICHFKIDEGNVKISGWKCAEDEDDQFCHWDYIL